MHSFALFLSEAKAGPGIQHIEHPSDRLFDGKEAAHHALNTLKNVANGSAPVTRKIDDRMSFQVIRDEHGRVGVKYKGPGSHYNFTPEDIDKQHGHKPYLAHPLKLLLEHAHKVLPNHPGEYQGGFMSGPESRTIEDGKISHQPNTIKYSTPVESEEGKKLKNSKVSMTVHTELKGPNKEAHPLSTLHGFKEHPDVHLVNHVVSSEDQRKIDPKIRSQAEGHIKQAEAAMHGHDCSHLEGHEEKLRRYINSTVSSGETPSTDGYKHFLKEKVHDPEINKVKMEKTKNAKTAVRDADLDHVEKNRQHFDKSFKIHGHLQAATNLLARGLGKVAGGEFEHHIDGQETGPEGFVSNGLKIVDRGEGGFSAANRARSAILKASPTLAKKV